MPPASSAAEQRRAIQTALADFARLPLPGAAYAMLAGLGYRSEKTADLGIDAETFLSSIEQFKPELGKISRDKVKSDHWKSCAFLFQLTNDEIPPLSLPSPASGRGGGGEGARSEDIARSQIESFVFLAIELQGESWSRTDLATIVRELNRRFPMPAIVIFKHGLPSPAGGREVGGEGISLAVIDRRANLKDAAKDVIDSRITVIKDVRIANPHRAHLDILTSLALESLGDKRRPTNFRELYDAWIEALSTQALNKRFYQELANWYFWALTQAQFPKDAPKDADGRDSLSLIRLITRIIFCWFLKEKGLLPDALFDPRKIATLLGDYNPTESTFYKAILQNLFFATLNQEMDKRVFRKAGQNFMAHNLYRYRSLMKNPDEVLKLLAGIPFMNGGLFECLDKTRGTKEKPDYVRIDGFSDRDDNPLKMPNDLFFGEERIVDLIGAYGDNKFKAAKVAGLIHILDRYKFTVAENTPIEEEVALDPELLGKVFENLLAAYNPETGATARKQTGSFYTPREIVNYMVDESLIASLERHLPPSPASRRGVGGEGMRADAQPPLPHPPAKLPDDIRSYARELRTSQTDAESLLWHLLRNRRFLNLKFRRQHPEGRYILDFYCDELKLVIELDGSQHFEQADYDQVRTEFLAKQGIRVLRFWNNQVLVETEGVLEAIYQAVMEMQAPSPPTPLPPAGEGGALARGEGGRAGEACSAPPAGEGSEARLRHLFAYNDQPHPFAAAEVEALIEAIDHLKILDPACGSGAFPMGVLHKLVFVLGKLDPGNRLWKARQLAKASEIPDATVRERVMDDIEQTFGANELDYGRKLYLIENCIHGVDIQPIAVQITKLRFFISLVVEQKINPQADNLGIRPLPNLETKFVAANTLIGINRPGQQLLRNLDIDVKEAELRRVRERHFLARTPATKAKCREQDATLRAEIAELLKSDGWNTATACALAEWNPYDQNASADFFDLEWMFGMMEGFDVAIGNPPYVRQEEIKHLKDGLKAHYDCFTGTADLYVYFYERSIKLLKPHGAFAFITSNKWYRAKYGEKLRDWMNRNIRLRRIIDFGDEAVFTAIAYPTIVIATRRAAPLLPSPASGRGAGGEGAGGEGRNKENVLALNWTQEHPVEQFPQVFSQAAFPVPQAELKKEGWQLEPPLKRRLLERIRAAGKPLGDYVNGRFYYGIKTGLNEAFVIDGATRARLIAEDSKSAEIIKPFLRGRDVKRWRVEFGDQYLIKIESSENVPHPWSGKPEAEAEKVFAQCYPAIHAYFQDYRQAMIDRYDQGKYFWELRACVYWQEFEQPKIIYPDIYLHQSFAWDTESFYAANTCYFIPTDEKWLTGLLNSSMIEWFYEQIANRIQNGYLRAFSDYMKQVSIPNANDSQKATISSLVDAVLALTALTPSPSPACGRGEFLPRFEQLINGLVFELFFPDDLHRANIRLFDACEKAGVGKLATLTPTPLPLTGEGLAAGSPRPLAGEGRGVREVANQLAATIFAPSHPIYAMLFDLQGLDVVRLVEGRECRQIPD